MTVKSKFRLNHISFIVVLMVAILVAFIFITRISVFQYGYISGKSIIWYVSIIGLFFGFGLLRDLLIKIEITKYQIIFKKAFSKAKKIEIAKTSKFQSVYKKRSGMSNSNGAPSIDPIETLIFHYENEYWEIDGNDYENYDDLKKEIIKNRKHLLT